MDSPWAIYRIALATFSLFSLAITSRLSNRRMAWALCWSSSSSVHFFSDTEKEHIEQHMSALGIQCVCFLHYRWISQCVTVSSHTMFSKFFLKTFSVQGKLRSFCITVQFWNEHTDHLLIYLFSWDCGTLVSAWGSTNLTALQPTCLCQHIQTPNLETRTDPVTDRETTEILFSLVAMYLYNTMLFFYFPSWFIINIHYCNQYKKTTTPKSIISSWTGIGQLEFQQYQTPWLDRVWTMMIALATFPLT